MWAEAERTATLRMATLVVVVEPSHRACATGWRRFLAALALAAVALLLVALYPRIDVGVLSSAVAGALAAAAGMLGKLGSDGDSLVLQWVSTTCLASGVDASVPCELAVVVARVACVGAMLATNALMLSFFVRGLHATDSLTATVTSAAVNFMLSAAAGHVVFGELLPARWFMGAAIILMGVACLLHGDTPVEDTEKKEQ